jgi:hypothetical protein
MKRSSRRLRNVFILLGALVVLEIGASQARAQYGMGGMGWGFMGMRMVPSPSESINQHSMIMAGKPSGPPPSNNVYANNPNSYINRVRDNGFTSHYSVGSRRPAGVAGGFRRPYTGSQSSTAAPAPQPESVAPSRPLIAIGSFFDDARKLVWPNDAPISGDLLDKRNTSDQACLTVADLVEKYRAAPITTVTDARQKLLDYGQPALSEIRSHSTPRIADAFHLFLLTLYDSLAQAGEPPSSGAAAIPPPPPP